MKLCWGATRGRNPAPVTARLPTSLFHASDVTPVRVQPRHWPSLYDPGQTSVTSTPRGSLRAITFDFWSTLIDGAVTPGRTAARLARLHAAIVGSGHSCTPVELEAAFHRALEDVGRQASETLRDVGPPGRWARLARELGIPEGLVPYEVVEHAYEDITLDPPPDPMPHVHEAVAGLKAAGYRLAVVCNTGMAGGRVLRRLLDHYGLLSPFDVTVWSNEFGWSKPDPRIFRHALEALGGVPPAEALHVGDLHELDVVGARRAGLHAAQYLPGSPAETATEADLLVRDWREFPDQVAAFARGLEAGPPPTASRRDYHLSAGVEA